MVQADANAVYQLVAWHMECPKNVKKTSFSNTVFIHKSRETTVQNSYINGQSQYAN
jgi:hypothetical protein